MYSVSVVIPAYNEEKRLPFTLEKIKKYFDSRDLAYEVIVVNDGSTDNTVEKAKSFSGLNLRVIDNRQNHGKGYCVRAGMLDARNDIILFSDADMSTPIEYLDAFLKLHEQSFDVIIASRAIDRKLVKAKQPLFREIMGRIFNFSMQAITGLRIRDTQCGFKSFKREAAGIIFKRQTIPGFGFDAEVLYIAKVHGFKIKETPVEWYDAPGTKVSVFNSAKAFIDLVDIKIKHLKGLYN
jgi:dolichyl-phosphate beta-glucosyltransferase